jgi:hypothetical protein
MDEFSIGSKAEQSWIKSEWQHDDIKLIIKKSNSNITIKRE